GWITDVVRSVSFPLQPVLGGLYGTRAGFWPSTFVFVSIPVLGFLALLFCERAWALARDWRAWRARVDRRGQLEAVLDRRAQVAALTLEVAGVERSRPARPTRTAGRPPEPTATVRPGG